MSRLGDLENSLVGRLATATLNGSPVFATVRGLTGGYRPAIRDAILRERHPAAFVAFTQELTAQELAYELYGARFSILVAARALRLTSNPRVDDGTAWGAFTLIDQVRARLDNYQPSSGIQMMIARMQFLEADDRAAIYELQYRAFPLFLIPNSPSAAGSYQTFVSGEVGLTWTPPAQTSTKGPQDYYRVYRKRAAESVYTLHHTAHKNATAIVLTGQPTGETLKYYLTAANTGGESGPSNTVTISPGGES